MNPVRGFSIVEAKADTHRACRLDPGRRQCRALQQAYSGGVERRNAAALHECCLQNPAIARNREADSYLALFVATARLIGIAPIGGEPSREQSVPSRYDCRRCTRRRSRGGRRS